MLVPASSAGAAQFGERDLRVGAKGKDVKTAQRYLARSGIRTKVDGRYGYGTARSVKRWERRQDYVANGRLTVSEQAAMAAQASGAVGYAEPDTAPEDKPAPLEKATLGADGLAVAPESAPEAVKAIIAAGNKIAKKPYRYGGGHGRWNDSGYDCSGSISYALHGAGLVSRPRSSGEYETWASSGRGEWITVYANGGHAYMVVAGLRFDTSGLDEDGSRWHRTKRPTDGYVVRHPRGL
jgi:cell wall-associated NlpC family hydrolase